MAPPIRSSRPCAGPVNQRRRRRSGPARMVVRARAMPGGRIANDLMNAQTPACAGVAEVACCAAC